ncbi:voltage-dependent calcium channel subunit alpha-2/delta-3 isoform X1 [Microplitis mediator]|uniref:voltage-dependent calcium channel subunit alpha-2/delta-3 isoform X1 n=1 Tax=Microplitis mediator TaxID=375433 RepID=UPI00255686E6|nr:voltage-dependent calcium channel subunit alpha-2/delta-3 isoform X1 [Microplitis mediator]XP_057336997.1 voltage-dependent calcium channel subunit alpha-2/delta-3 isoform X1 [Microplitis mediator]XP_057336998.1 voltage-dependent calcium channel subunit alpha-2/delta-3 isoform X1 [Microplitis mediator]XP_057336999.1 voltage-dependent calcium channel subunit alpha-2/delta-3 isoform X1 [Microplitis mediator]
MYRYVKSTLYISILFLMSIGISHQQEEDIPHNEVRNWALKFGVDLWEFGRQATKLSEIQRNYHGMEATVNKKDGLVLVREMAAEVKNMMDFKMNAVMRLMESAEQAAVSSPRDSTTSPRYYSSHEINRFTDDGKLTPGTRELLLSMNRHFDNLPVNLSMSAVLFPPGVEDSDSQVSSGLQWSDHLDPLFVNNYENDPTLSWQYFGATSGFLRRFPAISWPPRGKGSRPEDPDVHDFRMSDWFVGGATCPKDLTILVDSTSFSSKKLRKLTIATTKNILDTLSANDYVNVYRYSESVEETVQCFKDLLVQASPENVRQLKNSLYSIQSDSTANVSAAMATGFEILYKYNRTGQGAQCNQAIMLVTSNTETASSDLIKKYNWPHMPVRIFTYLVGGDKSSELQEMACANKGFYARVTSMEDVKTKVFEYVKVLARPMVLYQHDHPIHWTPAYVGGESSRYGEERRGQLMTSVTAPILDRRNHTVKTANLLGIVGTDVPIDQVQKLVPPYKLGVNGYSFIVDNNGRVLYHPDLRPLPTSQNYENSLHPRYTSVDLSEVELAEFEGPSYIYNNNSLLFDLRRDMIEQKEGETNFPVKIHYDSMKRVTIRRHNYFYEPIVGTPFSLGLALPEGYGMLEVHAELELKHAILNVFDYLNGSNWKVHPDWVYCEYSSASDKQFSTPEERILHFLGRTRMPGWKWMSMRPKSPSSHHNQASKPDKDAHYCDKRLVQSLVMDAVVTGGFNKRDTNLMHREDNQNPIAILMALLHSQGKGRFDVVRSFIATRSGLFRWHDHQDNKEAEDEPHFADMNKRAMDTSWYKRAAEQHAVEPESFVFSVPFNAAEMTEPLVTATHAVFFEGKNQHKAPAAVVGIQLQHSSLSSHFMNITSTCASCKKNCASTDLDCYILDNSGFIIISENNEHTGKFFGEIDGTIMDSLVQDRIYRKVTVVDYQGRCPPQESHLSSAPRTVSGSIIKTIVTAFGLIWSSVLKLNIYDAISPAFAWPNDSNSDDVDIKIDDETNSHESKNLSEEPTAGNDKGPSFPAVASPPTVPPATHATSAQYTINKVRPCEKKTDLYILQPERLNTSGQSNPLKGKLTNCHVTGCERPFSVQKILHTNLILLVVDTLCPCGTKQLSIEPTEAANEPGVCSARRDRLYRRRPPKCINYHPEEMEIKYCGSGSKLSLSYGLILALLSVYFT